MEKRYVELDMLRGVSIIGVILIHITSGLTDGISLFVNQASRFAVPSFLFLSGLGLTMSNKLKIGHINFIMTQLGKLMPLYIIWNIIYYLVNSIYPYSFIKFTSKTLLGTNYYHLYYVPITIFLYLIYPILIKVASRRFGLIIVLIITIISQYADVITGIDLFALHQNVFNWLFYFVLGIWAADNFADYLDKVKKHKLFLSVALGFSLFITVVESQLIQSTSSMRPIIILYSSIFILFALSIDYRDNLIKSTLLMLSDYSYGIFLSHALILSGFKKMYNLWGIGFHSIFYIMIAFITVIILSIFVTITIDKVILYIQNLLKRMM